MLNFPIAMLRVILLLFILFQVPAISISTPSSGMILRGQVEVVGNMAVPAFSSAELAFSYALNTTTNWFTIQTFPQPVEKSPLAIWDTSSVTDGDYTLRLRVYLLDGSFQEVIVTDLKIRNDMPEPTLTPEVILQPVISSPLPAIKTPLPTQVSIQSTPVPANPASLTPSLIFSTFGRGVSISLALFVFISLLLRKQNHKSHDS